MIHLTQADSDRRLWWSSFALLGLLMATWAMSAAPYSSIDEQAHSIKSAAVVRGQLIGSSGGSSAWGGALTMVRVPAAQVGDPGCFAGKPGVTPDCAHLATSTATVVAGTAAGHYPPIYYAAVGIGSVLDPGPRGFYLMRLLSAALAAALLASALCSIRRWGAGIGPVGLAVALSPMVVSVASSVNPNGFEMAAAICTWTSLLALLAAPEVRDTRLLVRLAIAATLLVTCRPLSPVWLAAIVVVACIPTGWSALRIALARRDVWIGVAVVFVATLVAAAWTVLAHALRVVPDPNRVTLGPGAALNASLGRLPNRLAEMIGVFGWFDARPPLFTYVVWTVLIGLLVVLALATASRLGTCAVLLALGLTILIPLLLEVSKQNSFGLIWQGRYTIPFAVGVPLLAARVIRLNGGPLVPQFTRRLAIVSIAMLMSAQLAAFVWAMRRYTVGVGNGLGLGGGTNWEPPLPPLLLAVCAALLLILLGVRFYAEVQVDEPEADEIEAEVDDFEPLDELAQAAPRAGATEPVRANLVRADEGT